MSAATVFSRPGLSRSDPWENHIGDLTPVEERGGRWYKREDYFAPLGYGGVNGSKLRQLIYLIDDYTRADGGRGILTGASVLSPQISMAAVVGAHYGLPVTVVLGATNRRSSMRHDNVAIAAASGARFEFTPVAYNPALQRAVADLSRRAEFAGWYRLHYGITTGDDDPKTVESFHRVGAAQVRNMPPEVETLVMTAGSCNSCVSVLYGLAREATNIRRVVLLGIGPTRLAFIHHRLALIEDATGLPIRSILRPLYHNHRDLEDAHRIGDGPVVLEHFDLHSTGYTKYADRVRWTEDGIIFHPTYEGKAMRFLFEIAPPWWTARDGTTAFWIVGSPSTREAMRGVLDGSA